MCIDIYDLIYHMFDSRSIILRSIPNTSLEIGFYCMAYFDWISLKQ